jgi:hypothetical protein
MWRVLPGSPENHFPVGADEVERELILAGSSKRKRACLASASLVWPRVKTTFWPVRATVRDPSTDTGPLDLQTPS